MGAINTDGIAFLDDLGILYDNREIAIFSSGCQYYFSATPRHRGIPED